MLMGRATIHLCFVASHLLMMFDVQIFYHLKYIMRNIDIVECRIYITYSLFIFVASQERQEALVHEEDVRCRGSGAQAESL